MLLYIWGQFFNWLVYKIPVLYGNMWSSVCKEGLCTHNINFDNLLILNFIYFLSQHETFTTNVANNWESKSYLEVSQSTKSLAQELFLLG